MLFAFDMSKADAQVSLIEEELSVIGQMETVLRDARRCVEARLVDESRVGDKDERRSLDQARISSLRVELHTVDDALGRLAVVRRSVSFRKAFLENSAQEVGSLLLAREDGLDDMSQIIGRLGIE